MKRKILVYLCLLFGFVAAPLLAQHGEDVIFENRIIVDAPGEAAEMEAAPAPGTFMFLSSEFEIPDKPVKGAPYSAEAVTERTQQLSDGNRIVQKSTAFVYRDSEGRTRREHEFGPIGPFAHGAEPHRSVFINDPVKGEHYVFEPDGETVRKMKAPEEQLHSKRPHHGAEDVMIATAPHANMGVVQFFGGKTESKTETMGKQFIEGVEAEGTRTRTVIPAGQIGNERDIEIVSEKWYSSELQVNIMTKHVDPRFGETVYQLRNLNRSEPDRSLFEIPAGYKVVDGFEGERIMIKKTIKN